MRTLLYDFRRALLNSSTLVLLAALVAVGAAVGYMAYAQMTGQGKLFGIAYTVTPNSSAVKVEGLVYDYTGNPVKDNTVTVKLLECSEGGAGASMPACSVVAEWTARTGERFKAELRRGSTNASVNLEIRVANRYGSSLSWSSGIRCFPADMHTSLGIGFGSTFNKTWLAVGEVIPLEGGGYRLAVAVAPPDCNYSEVAGSKLYYTVYNETPGRLAYAGELGASGVGVFDLKAAGSGKALYLELETRRGRVRLDTPVSLAGSSALKGWIVAAMLVSSNVLAFLYPIAVMLTAYNLVAKPRSTGALEFVLARPVTRLQLFLSRFAAGALASAASPLLATAAMHLVISWAVGSPPPLEDSALLAAGIAASMLAYYSVFYSIAASAKGKSYLLLAVVVYIVFTVLWAPIAFAIAVAVRGTPDPAAVQQAYYFNPSVAFQAATEALHLKYGQAAVQAALKPAYVAAAAAAWVLLPLVAAWLAFRKANLSQ
ncbi:ABC transporter permease subunit [Thermofilum pendens]|uniref:ABC transporter permease n=1 Tax=Thermofilum pendens (strain DSM 2475 / Hrk 5) TaxID=368408 RepID=A1RZP2_THEPD|nr:ABC transporter permease subunit [Thermofilum pendens]ABL78672.1 hypothetical protein Tpen_1274 [Thermofilum pendens Hrk 5]